MAGTKLQFLRFLDQEKTKTCMSSGVAATHDDDEAPRQAAFACFMWFLRFFELVFVCVR